MLLQTSVTLLCCWKTKRCRLMLMHIIFFIHRRFPLGARWDVSAVLLECRWPLPDCVPDHSNAGSISADHGCDEPVRYLHALPSDSPAPELRCCPLPQTCFVLLPPLQSLGALSLRCMSHACFVMLSSVAAASCHVSCHGGAATALAL